MHLNSAIDLFVVIAISVIALLVIQPFARLNLLGKYSKHIVAVVIEDICLVITAIVVGLWLCRIFGV